MAITSVLILIGFGERGLKFHVARKELSGGAHGGVQLVVADSIDGAPAYEISLAHLLAVAANILVVRVGGLKPHRRPHLERRTSHAVASADELFVSSAVVEEVELDEFNALIFKIEERPSNAALSNELV